MRLLSGMVLLKITAEDKKKIFEKDVHGTILFKAVEENIDMAGAFEQTVSSGIIIAVADDVKHIQPGDIAILDYILETLVDKQIYQDDTGKYFCVDSRTIFHEDDKIVYASLLTKTDQYVWCKGDVDEASLIYGVFRDDQLIPNPPYIFCEHKDFKITHKTDSGISYQEMEMGTVIRRVLVPNEHTGEDIEPGSLVVVQDYTLYERSLDGKMFDVIMNQDIEIVIE